MTISGTVFQDYDNDGTRETGNAASELGYEDIIVTAYFSDGTTATDTTDASGNYSISNTNSLAARVEFTNLPDGYFGSSLDSADANTFGSIFFNDGTSQTANFGIYNPNQYITNTSPTLIIPCYVFSGASGVGSQAAIVTVLHSDSGDSNRSPNTEATLVTFNDVGTVNGLAYNNETQDLFAGTFQKRHSDVKNQKNGVIYRVETSNSNTVNELIDLDDFFGANAAGAYAHDTAASSGFSSPFHVDAAAFDAVGKVALGDVEISEDRQYIWTINLEDRSLYKIEIGDGSKHTVGDGRERVAYPILGDDNTNPTNGGIPLDDLGLNPNANIRPFALSIKDGLVYVGMVNSAERDAAGTGKGTSADLHAYVYTFDPATATFSSSPVVDFALNYPRQRKGVNDSQPIGAGATAAWDPWVSDWEEFTFDVYGSSFDTFANDVPAQTQPWLTDIEFDRNGNMILGLRDRTADQVGNRVPNTDGELPNNDDPDLSPVTNNLGFRAFSGGDILRATPSTTAGSWDIEDITIADDEFYGGEFLLTDHYETAQGGLLQLPGYDHVVTTALDPLNFDTGGLIKLSDSDGEQITTGIELYDNGGDNLGKANGLGDVEFFSELAPIEIGNRIWTDTNADGIQDAGEAGINNVTVNLYNSDGSTLLGTTTTDANGEYYFNESNITGGLEPNTPYQIQIASSNFGSGQSLENLNLTVANQGSNELIDSDAVNVSSIATITATTGDFGENDFTLDAGFTSQEFDYGDAPDTGSGTGTGNYETTVTNGGPSHVIISGLSIGSAVDGDDGTLQNTAADADDNSNTGSADDEDGIASFDPLATNATSYSVDVDVTNTTGGDVTLIGWVDFNGDGEFGTDEEAIATVNNNDISATLNWSTIPAGMSAGNTYARFRISSDSLTESDSIGAATDGEVEDYQLEIKNGITGNDYSETLTNSTTDINDLFIGGAGQDTLTGNGGGDCFKFSVTSDGIDIITDFDAATSTTFDDRLDLSEIFNNELSVLTITDDPFTGGYVKAVTFGSDVMIQIDPTPSDSSDDVYAKSIALLESVSASNIDASDFIF